MAYDWFTLHFPITSHFRANFLYLFSQTNFFCWYISKWHYIMMVQLNIMLGDSIRIYLPLEMEIYFISKLSLQYLIGASNMAYSKKSTRIPFSSHCCCSNRNPLRKERKWKKLMIWFSSISIELAAVKNGI